MALEEEAKKPTSADADAAEGSSSMSMAMAEPGDANEPMPPPQPLPLAPGVQFSPTREDCLALLDGWIGGDDDMADTQGCIVQANFYSASPDALRRLHPPATARDGRHAWWFLSETKFKTPREGEDTTKHVVDRRVESGGCWRTEQRSKENLPLANADDCFAFYPGPSNKGRTPWRMEEFTGAVARALCRLYVSPRATEDELREVYGEDGVPVAAGSEGNGKTVRATVPVDYFDAVAALLPPGSARGLGRGHVVLRGVYREDGAPVVGSEGNERPVGVTVPAEHFDVIAALLPPGSVRPDRGQEHVVLRGVYGEDPVTVGSDGKKGPVRVMVRAEYFDVIAALLSPGSVRPDRGQEHVELPHASQQPDEPSDFKEDC